MNQYLLCINTLACPVKGQIRKECASHPSCHRTCDDTNTTVCPAVCIVYGCECPNGTIIDEKKNECVAPEECKGMYNNQSWRTYINVLSISLHNLLMYI